METSIYLSRLIHFPLGCSAPVVCEHINIVNVCECHKIEGCCQDGITLSRIPQMSIYPLAMTNSLLLNMAQSKQ